MKQEMMSILFYALKSRTLKTGEAPLILRITINGASDETRIQRSVPIHLWNAAKGYSKGKDRASLELNEYIRSLNLKLLTIHKGLMLEEAVITVYFTPKVYRYFNPKVYHFNLISKSD